jgi:hypothetical protein
MRGSLVRLVLVREGGRPARAVEIVRLDFVTKAIGGTMMRGRFMKGRRVLRRVIVEGIVRDHGDR